MCETRLENFVSKKMFCDGSRLISGKVIKYLLRKNLIWSQWNSKYMKENWLQNLRDDRYYFVEKKSDEGADDYDYWYSVCRVYLRNRPEEELELLQARMLADKVRRNRPMTRRPRTTRATV